MQGKQRNNEQVDEAFVSEAWQSMSQMLDEAMPVEVSTPSPKENQGYKRYLPLLLLFLGFGMGASVMYWYAFTKEGTPKPQVIQQKAPTAENNNILEEENAISSESVLAAVSTPNQSLVDNPKIDNTNTNVVTERPSTTYRQRNNIQNWQADLLQATPTKKESEIDFKWVPKDAFVGTSKDMMQGEDAGSSSPSVLNRNEILHPIGEPLPLMERPSTLQVVGLQKQATALLAKEDYSITTPEVVLPKIQKWNVALQASAIRDDETKEFGGGYTLGVMAERKLDNRFALQGGVHWHHLVKTSQNNTENNISASNIGSLPGVQNFDFKNLLDFRSASAPIKDLNYLKVPVQLFFKLNKQLRFHTGVHAAYLLAPNNLTDINPDQVPLEQLSAEEQLAIKLDTRSKLAWKGLRKLDFGCQIGFGFFPTNRIGVNLNYNIGWIDFSDNEYFGVREAHTNQYLQLGLNYYLR